MTSESSRIAGDITEFAELAHVIEDRGFSIHNVDVTIKADAGRNPLMAAVATAIGDDIPRKAGFTVTVVPRADVDEDDLDDVFGDTDLEDVDGFEFGVDATGERRECPECGETNTLEKLVGSFGLTCPGCGYSTRTDDEWLDVEEPDE